MNKTEAAEYLGCSVRAVERYAQLGRLAGRYERGKSGKVLVFDEADLERLKGELDASEPRPTARSQALALRSPEADSRSLARSDVPASPVIELQVLAALQTLAPGFATARQGTTIDVADKPLLTLAEAQTVTGLSRGILKAAIDASQLKAQQIGRAWRVKRSDLDKWIESL